MNGETTTRQRSWRRVFRRKREPVIERRLRVCNMGSIYGGEATEWSADPHDADAQAFRDKHSDLKCFGRCPWSHYDWDIHVPHLVVDEREAS